MIEVNTIRPDRLEAEELGEPVPNLRELEALSPLSSKAIEVRDSTRAELGRTLRGLGRRMILLVGGCNLDFKQFPDGRLADLELMAGLARLRTEIEDDAMLLARACVFKPRSGLGSTGADEVNLVQAHQMVTEAANMGLPIALEVMSEGQLARYQNLASAVWVGSRDVSSTVLRRAVAGYPEIPALIKNGEDGRLAAALTAIQTASQPHRIEKTDRDGRLRFAQAPGNPGLGLILRGGSSVKTVEDFEARLAEAQESDVAVLTDCAHGNEVLFDPERQKSVAGQLACAEHVIDMVQNQKMPPRWKGLMLEVNLLAGSDPEIPGMSSMDPCISLEQARDVIFRLIKARRQAEARADARRMAIIPGLFNQFQDPFLKGQTTSL